MIKCKCCGEEITSIKTGIFDYDGNDSDYEIPLSDGGNAVLFETGRAWVGYELSEEEQRECIYCPKCGKYPFGDGEIGIEEPVVVCMFKE